ncbi:MAG: flagellar motor protein MotB [Synechocystis sp.]
MDNFLGNDISEESLEEQDAGVWLSVGDLMSGLLMFFALLFIAVSAQLVEYDNIIKKIPTAIIDATKKIPGLGDSIKLEPNGDLSLDNKILFAEGKSDLSPEGKKFLTNFIPIYSQTIFSNKIFDDQVSRIIIEGHTSSKGKDQDNMNLSFQRALAVMEFINSINFPEKKALKEKLLAAGRG